MDSQHGLLTPGPDDHWSGDITVMIAPSPIESGAARFDGAGRDGGEFVLHEALAQ
ncbi:MAG TPA: hypothetical protein VHB98_00485 [Chloroflexota bacterium]|nr:hypothetical protein [Chloroflexota bacterium]